MEGKILFPLLSNADFLKLGPPPIWGEMWVLCWRKGCSVHWRMFNSISSFYPLDSSSTPSPGHPQVETIGNVFRHFQEPPGDRQLPPVENHWSNRVEMYFLLPLSLYPHTPQSLAPMSFYDPGTQASHTYDFHPYPSDLYRPRFFSAALFTRSCY